MNYDSNVKFWEGYDTKHYLREVFVGTYAEALDYFNSDKCNPFVDFFCSDEEGVMYERNGKI